jgi:hypothetical protein
MLRKFKLQIVHTQVSCNSSDIVIGTPTDTEASQPEFPFPSSREELGVPHVLLFRMMMMVHVSMLY